MFFQAAESRARHAFVDRSIEALAEQLQNPVVGHHLGGLVTETQCRLIEDVYVPDLSGSDVIVPPRVLETDRTIILALKEGKENAYLSPSAAAPSPIQLQRIRMELAGISSTEEIQTLEDRIFNLPPFLANFDLGLAAGAYAHTPYADYSGLRYGYPGMKFKGRPYIVLGWDNKKGRTVPWGTSHELIHYDQDLRHPVDYVSSKEEQENLNLQRELEARYNDAKFIRALVACHYTPVKGERLGYSIDGHGNLLSDSTIIDDLRREVNGDGADRFATGDELKGRLKEINAFRLFLNR